MIRRVTISYHSVTSSGAQSPLIYALTNCRSGARAFSCKSRKPPLFRQIKGAHRDSCATMETQTVLVNIISDRSCVLTVRDGASLAPLRSRLLWRPSAWQLLPCALPCRQRAPHTLHCRRFLAPCASGNATSTMAFISFRSCIAVVYWCMKRITK